MASVGTTAQIILLSIRPAFAALAFSQRKLFEYRRARVGVRSGDLVLLYETAPVGLITGQFRVGGVRYGHAELAQGEPDVRVRELVEEYLLDVSCATAIEITRLERFVEPVTLDEVLVRRPPQSYMFLGKEVWDSLESQRPPKQ
jgi:predicted transcriptional regulator